MTSPEIALFATRLVVVSAALLLGPGVLLLVILRVKVEWPERITLAFAASYCWLLLLSMLVPLFGWTADSAALLTVLLLFSLGVAAVRRGGRTRLAPPDAAGALLIAVTLLAAPAAWMIESPFTGEEALDFASISRFADGGPISFDNTSLLPNARPVYLFQPYQLAVGIVARWSGVEPLVAFVKFRAIIVPLALIFLFSLVRRLLPNRSDAMAVFAVMLLFIALDFDTWELNSLFPLIRRGGVGAGLCVPVLLLLCIVATRRSEPREDTRVRRIALMTAPAMLAASLATHPLEVFPVLCFVAGMTAVIIAGVDRHGDRRQALILAALLATSAVTYLAVQSRFVPYVAEYEEAEKQSRREELADFADNPIAGIIGRPAPGEDMLTRTVPTTSAVVFGTVALPLAALIAPGAAAIIAAGIMPLALVYATPAGYLVLTLLTSVETVRDINSYFSLLSLIALALALTAAAHMILRIAASPHGTATHLIQRAVAISIVAWIMVALGQAAARALAGTSAMEPRILLAAGTLAAVVTLIVSRRDAAPRLRRSPFPTGVAVVTACLAVPFAQPDAGIGGTFTTRQPVDVMTRLQIASAAPSVLAWDDYYERLRETIAPPLPVPRAVVDELRRRIPPRQIVLAHPRYSCALVVLLDAYCINPASIYGHYFQPAVGYYRTYVADRGSDSPQHPFFNSAATISDAERTVIRDMGVAYVLTDPQYGGLISAKLVRAVEGAHLEMSRDGYQLYRVTATSASTAGR
jgi:hypothetical protein